MEKAWNASRDLKWSVICGYNFWFYAFSLTKKRGLFLRKKIKTIFWKKKIIVQQSNRNEKRSLDVFSFVHSIFWIEFIRFQCSISIRFGKEFWKIPIIVGLTNSNPRVAFKKKIFLAFQRKLFPSYIYIYIFVKRKIYILMTPISLFTSQTWINPLRSRD